MTWWLNVGCIGVNAGGCDPNPAVYPTPALCGPKMVPVTPLYWAPTPISFTPTLPNPNEHLWASGSLAAPAVSGKDCCGSCRSGGACEGSCAKKAVGAAGVDVVLWGDVEETGKQIEHLKTDLMLAVAEPGTPQFLLQNLFSLFYADWKVWFELHKNPTFWETVAHPFWHGLTGEKRDAYLALVSRFNEIARQAEKEGITTVEPIDTRSAAEKAISAAGETIKGAGTAASEAAKSAIGGVTTLLVYVAALGAVGLGAYFAAPFVMRKLGAGA